MLMTRVCIVGPKGVGKTSIAARIDDAALSSQTCPSGTRFVSCNVLFREKSLNLEILDVSGEEKLQCMAPIYYREAKAALCVFDVTSEKTFNSLNRWIDSTRNNAREDCQLIILGNKVDLEDLRQVTKEAAEKYAVSVGATFFEVSAVTGPSVPSYPAASSTSRQRKKRKKEDSPFQLDG